MPKLTLNLRSTISEPEKLMVLVSDLLITETENWWAEFLDRRACSFQQNCFDVNRKLAIHVWKVSFEM